MRDENCSNIVICIRYLVLIPMLARDEDASFTMQDGLLRINIFADSKNFLIWRSQYITISPKAKHFFIAINNFNNKNMELHLNEESSCACMDLYNGPWWIGTKSVCAFLEINARTLKRICERQNVDTIVIQGKRYYNTKDLKLAIDNGDLPRNIDNLNHLLEHYNSYVDRE